MSGYGFYIAVPDRQGEVVELIGELFRLILDLIQLGPVDG